MQELIKKIEQWAEDRNIINGSKPIDQAMKLFSEFGELADNVGKGRDCRDDIGDCIVVLTIIAKQIDLDISEAISFEHEEIESCLKDTVAFLGYEISNLLSSQTEDDELSFIFIFGLLYSIANKVGTTLQECVQIAYDDIKNRKGVVYNGTFIKDTDPAYNEALQKLGKA